MGERCATVAASAWRSLAAVFHLAAVYDAIRPILRTSGYARLNLDPQGHEIEIEVNKATVQADIDTSVANARADVAADIATAIANHAALPNVHHTPTPRVNPGLSQQQVTALIATHAADTDAHHTPTAAYVLPVARSNVRGGVTRATVGLVAMDSGTGVYGWPLDALKAAIAKHAPAAPPSRIEA